MNDKRSAYPGRPPKKYPKPDLHGRVRWVSIPYYELDRAIKFYADVFGWNFVDAAAGVNAPDPSRRYVYGTTGPSQPGTEGNVPGFINFSLVYHEDLGDQMKVTAEVHMDESIRTTLDKVEEYGGKVLSVTDSALEDGLQVANWNMSATIEDPDGNTWHLWRVPGSRTWEEPETGYDKE